MAKRIVSTFLLWSLVFVSLWFFRARGALVLLTVVSALTLWEFYRLMGAMGYMPFMRLGVSVGAFITLSPWFEARLGLPAHLWLAFAVIAFSIRLLRERTPETRVEALCSTLFGLAYVSFMLGFFTRIIVVLPGDTVSPDGRLLMCLWVVATAKFCDMGALLTGMAIGRHKMSPQISPKKTWEGAVGGVVFSMAIGATIAWLARAHFPPHLTPLVAAVMAVPIAILGIIADLIESVIKRRANLKDSGVAIPGLGGFFDMSDSLILAAPVGYFFFGLP
ncbi:MAG: phosphatidate cytidylyltransferase [Verrucomicrobia bacterium]|nr:phosphatidate cytidylyltransferase [Verrucomicrobiota bacterium]